MRSHSSLLDILFQEVSRGPFCHRWHRAHEGIDRRDWRFAFRCDQSAAWHCWPDGAS